MLCGLAVFLLPACIIATPWGLAPSVALIVPVMLLAPDLMRAAWRPSRAMVVPLLLLAACVAAVAPASKLASDVTWNEADNRAGVQVSPLLARACGASTEERRVGDVGVSTVGEWCWQ